MLAKFGNIVFQPIQINNHGRARQILALQQTGQLLKIMVVTAITLRGRLERRYRGVES